MSYSNCSQEIIIIFPLSSLSKRTRLAKLARIASECGLTIRSWAWERVPGEAKEDKDFSFSKKSILLRGGGWSNPRLKYYYLLWMLRVFWQMIKLRPKTVVYCLGFETAFPVWLAKPFTGTEYIFDDADRFSMIIKFPKHIQKLVRFFERKTSEGSKINIIPGLERYEFKNPKQRVIKNMPDRDALKRSADIGIERPESSLVIYVNGWLGETRGLPTINQVAKELEGNKKVHFLVAGRLDGESSKQFISLSNVTYLGEVESATALAAYRVSDLIFTYYDPNIEINNYAESNKWGDALYFGIPVIVNTEVITARFLREANAAISAPYDDYLSLSSSLRKLSTDTETLNQLKKNMRSLGGNIEFFDDKIRKLLEELY